MNAVSMIDESCYLGSILDQHRHNFEIRKAVEEVHPRYDCRLDEDEEAHSVHDGAEHYKYAQLREVLITTLKNNPCTNILHL